MALLIPLAILAVVGSWELSVQRQRAETYLRSRAFDFLATAVSEFDQRLQRYCEVLLDETLSLDQPLVQGVIASRISHPELLEVMIFDSNGDIDRPRTGPPIQVTPPYGVGGTRARELWIAPALAHRGAADAAIELLESRLATPAGGDEGDEKDIDQARARVHMQMQLAGLYRGAGDLRRAYDLFRQARDAHGELPSRPGRSVGRRHWFRFIAEAASLDLLGRLACAELRCELEHESDELVQLLADLGSGRPAYVVDDLLLAVFDRAAAALPVDDPARATIADAQEGVQQILAGRQLVRDFQDRAGPQLRSRLASAPAGELVYQAYELESTSALLVARRAEPTDANLKRGQWIGAFIDLTAYANRELAPLFSPRPDGFYLDLLGPSGERLLRYGLPDGAAAWRSDAVSQTGLAGIQFLAIPRNAHEQLESRRASTRNRALLLLALCLVAGGGAFFLVRSVGREAELASLKVDLVSRVSHELRTPLALIKMYGDTLALGRTRNQEETTRFAAIISRESDRLTVMIDRILDFSQLEAGELSYQKRDVDLSELVSHVANEYGPRVASAGMVLTSKIEPGIHTKTDPDAMERALVNLLENAVKYTPAPAPGTEIEVELGLVAGGRAVQLEVRDRGMGVPDNERRKIFTSFFRGESAAEARGAGLGLSLVEHFVNAHGGTIEALEHTGGGTIFRLTLPIEPTSNRDEQRT